MLFKSQLRFHIRPLAAVLLLVAGVLSIVAVFSPSPKPTGVALEDVPFYQLPFGRDENGVERPFWPSRMLAASGRLSDPARLPSSQECATCHSKEFEEWAGSLHAAAGRDLVYEKTVEANKRLTRHGMEQSRFCESCHAPAEVLSGRTNRFVSVAPADALTEGVSCISCHTATHADPIEGNGALTLALDRAETDRERLTNAQLLAAPKGHLAAYGAEDTHALMAKSDLCGACHTEAYDLSMSKAKTRQTVQSTFVEWRDSWYAKNNITCQDCHMAPDPAVYIAGLQAGKTGKPERYSHRFIGANHVMTDTGLGDTLGILRGGLLPGVTAQMNRSTLEEQARLTASLLRSAADLQLRSSRIDAGKLHLEIAVRNRGAGHNFPTGVSDQKHMLLEIKGFDASGKIAFSSDGTEKDGNGAWLEYFLDADGKRILNHLTFATSAITWERHAIPPRGEDVVGYEFSMPDGLVGPLRIEARLLYRVALPDLIYTNLKLDLPVPDFSLAELSTDLPMSLP